MRLNLKATNIVLGDSVKDYLEKRLRSLDKLISLEDPAVIVDAELGCTTRHHQTGDIFFAEVTIHRGRDTFRSVSNCPDIHTAIDDVRDELARGLSSKKGKLISLSRRGGQMAKALLRGGYGGLEYLGRPAKAGWKYMRGLWPRNK